MRMNNSTSESGSGLWSKAAVSMVLRFVVSGYILYLAWRLFSGAQGGTSPIPMWGTILVCAVFAAAAVVFSVYAWLMYRRSVKASAAQALPKTDDDSQQR